LGVLLVPPPSRNCHLPSVPVGNFCLQRRVFFRVFLVLLFAEVLKNSYLCIVNESRSGDTRRRPLSTCNARTALKGHEDYSHHPSGRLSTRLGNRSIESM